MAPRSQIMRLVHAKYQKSKKKESTQQIKTGRTHCRDTYVVVRGAANGAAFAFDALPPVLAHRNDHVRGKLQTRWMPYNKNVTRFCVRE